jgi:hypothetical protein
MVNIWISYVYNVLFIEGFEKMVYVFCQDLFQIIRFSLFLFLQYCRCRSGVVSVIVTLCNQEGVLYPSLVHC